MFFGITNIWAYVVGTFLIILLPGPNALFVLSTAAQRGVRSGYQAACGVFTGDAVLMFLSSAGVASLLKSTPILFTVVKYSGAAYLAWLGFGMLRSARKSWRSPATGAAPAPPAAPPRQANPFRKALGISLLNPKAILFFVAFFVQFVDPSYGAPALSFLILAMIVQVFSFCYLSTLIFGGTYLANQFRRRRRLSAGLTSGVGAIFLAFGVKLATATLS